MWVDDGTYIYLNISYHNGVNISGNNNYILLYIYISLPILLCLTKQNIILSIKITLSLKKLIFFLSFFFFSFSQVFLLIPLYNFIIIIRQCLSIVILNLINNFHDFIYFRCWFVYLTTYALTKSYKRSNIYGLRQGSTLFFPNLYDYYYYMVQLGFINNSLYTQV